MHLPQRFILEASLLLLTSYSLGYSLTGQLPAGEAICSIPRRDLRAGPLCMRSSVGFAAVVLGITAVRTFTGAEWPWLLPCLTVVALLHEWRLHTSHPGRFTFALTCKHAQMGVICVKVCLGCRMHRLMSLQSL